MKKSSQINKKDLQICDLIIFKSKTLDKRQEPSNETNTKCANQNWYWMIGTKDATFTA